MHVPSLIEKKRDGGELSAEEIEFLVREFTDGNIPDYQMSNNVAQVSNLRTI